MASLMRFRSVHKLTARLVSFPCAKPQQTPIGQKLCRLVGTSGAQKSETATASTTSAASAAKTTAEECDPKKKIWLSYGYSYEDEYLDKHFLNLAGVVIISIVITLGTYILMYLPDFRKKDWACREAYLELRRRESLGLLPIDPNLIDPAKVHLPTDEELGDTEIII